MTSQPPLVIPVFVPHRGCPHRCAFCNQSVISGQDAAMPDKRAVFRQVETFLGYRKGRTRVELAFFGGNFLGIREGERQDLLAAARSLVMKGMIHGVRFSTRPDTVTPETLRGLAGCGVDTVELGVQSMDDAVLSASLRGHTADRTRAAAELLHRQGLRIGMQMMVGLPGDTDETALATAQAIAGMAPAFVRIYPLLVLYASPLYQWYLKGEYRPMDLDPCVALVKRLYTLFTDRGIRVIRMGLQASEILQGPDGIAAGPWHPAFGHLVLSGLFLDKALAALERSGRLSREKPIILRVHPSSQARLRGDRNRNLEILTSAHAGGSVSILPDPACPPGEISIDP